MTTVAAERGTAPPAVSALVLLALAVAGLLVGARRFGTADIG